MASPKKSCFLAALVVFAVLSPCNASINGPELKKPAPPLNLSNVLQAPADASANLEALRGKVVVIDFWATWCGPCRKSIPHWNELVDGFKGKPVQFIAITDEDEGGCGRVPQTDANPFMGGTRWDGSIHA
jgi:thiol-disulfide isomerase/thioredoxin